MFELQQLKCNTCLKPLTEPCLLPCVGGMGLGMSGEGMAYGYTPGPGYAWAPVHPANPPSETPLVIFMCIQV